MAISSISFCSGLKSSGGFWASSRKQVISSSVKVPFGSIEWNSCCLNSRTSGPVRTRREELEEHSAGDKEVISHFSFSTLNWLSNSLVFVFLGCKVTTESARA